LRGRPPQARGRSERERGAADLDAALRVLRWALLGVLIWVALAGAWTLWAVHAADSGRDRLLEVRTTLSPEDLLSGAGTDEIRAAQEDFERAESRVGSPVVAPLRWLPGVSDQVESLEAMTSAAADVSEVAGNAVEEASAELNGAVPTGQGRVQLLRDVADVAERASAQVAVVDLGPTSGLLGPIRTARDDLTDELTQLELTMLNVRDATRGMAEVFEGPSTYLLMAANNAEMRAGSGMFLSLGVLTFDGGELSLGPMTPSGELWLEEGVEYTDATLEERWSWAEPDREYRNLAMSPRFPAFAEMASRMWEAGEGEAVDGVLAVDPFALQALLGAVGPVDVDGQEVSADTVVPLLLHDQYVGLDTDDDPNDDQGDRRATLSSVAEAVVAQFDRSSPDLAVLAEGLRSSAAARHLLLWSGDRALQRVWTDVGVGGAVDGDDLYLSVDNYGQNKLDQFLEVSGEIDIDPGPDGTEVVLRASLRNETPQGEPGYITGEAPTDDKPPGTYAGLVTITMPELAEVEPEERFSVFGPDGASQVVSQEVLILPGEQATVEVRFRLPEGVSSFEVGPSARFPAISWREGASTWFDDQSPRVRVTW
jgi:hypothetical protein